MVIPCSHLDFAFDSFILTCWNFLLFLWAMSCPGFLFSPHSVLATIRVACLAPIPSEDRRDHMATRRRSRSGLRAQGGRAGRQSIGVGGHFSQTLAIVVLRTCGSESAQSPEKPSAETYLTLTAIALAVNQLLPRISYQAGLVLGIAIVSAICGLAATLSAYGCLWQIASATDQEPFQDTGLHKITSLLRSPSRGPTWFLGLALALVLVLSLLSVISPFIQ
jgi:hypothetical protein